MFRGNWGRYLAAGLIALGVSTVSAGERITYNETVLDCVLEGCFVVRYVPAPSLKPESNSKPNGAEINQSPKKSQAPPNQNIPLTQIGDAQSKRSNGKEEKTEDDGAPRKLLGVYSDVWEIILSAALVGSTIILTASTIGLWRRAGRQTKYARKQASAGLEQAQVMRQTLAQMQSDTTARVEQFDSQLAVAQQGANAAIKASEIAAQEFILTRNQLVPLIMVDSATVEVRKDNHMVIVFRFFLANYGRNPASHVEVFGRGEYDGNYRSFVKGREEGFKNTSLVLSSRPSPRRDHMLQIKTDVAMRSNVPAVIPSGQTEFKIVVYNAPLWRNALDMDTDQADSFLPGECRILLEFNYRTALGRQPPLRIHARTTLRGFIGKTEPSKMDVSQITDKQYAQIRNQHP